VFSFLLKSMERSIPLSPSNKASEEALENVSSISDEGVPALRPLVPALPPDELVAVELTELAFGPITAVVTGLVSQVNLLMICAEAVVLVKIARTGK
jgi:hypothetical protein